MKRVLLTLLLLCIVIFVQAQIYTDPNTGNIGIGTTTANQKLTINGGGIGFDWNSTDKKLYSPADGDLEWATQNGAGVHGFAVSNSGNRLIYLNTNGNSYLNGGNLGIGTTTPNAKVDVNGAIVLLGSTSNTMVRPTVTPARIGGEVSSYSAAGLAYDDGFLRLSAGGGTTASVKTFIDLTGYSTVPDMDRNIVFGTGGSERIRINYLGNVGIGTQNPDTKLAVRGTVHATEVLVDETVPTPDYVFDKDYDLTSLKDIKAYIDQNHHLPEIPSAAQVAKEGINLGEMNAKLLKKIEELTLYLIEKDKEVKAQAELAKEQNEKLKQQEYRITQLEQILTPKSK